MFRDLKAVMNVACAKWKVSGNGKDNLSVELNSLEYDSDEDDAVFVKDNRFDFCSNSVPVGYFWCVAEMHNLVAKVSQNCGSI